MKVALQKLHLMKGDTLIVSMAMTLGLLAMPAFAAEAPQINSQLMQEPAVLNVPQVKTEALQEQVLDTVELSQDNTNSFDPPEKTEAVSLQATSTDPDDDIEEIITDRPDFTEATNTIAPGSLQFEGGFTFEREGDRTRTWNFPEGLFRLGVLKTTELRFGAPQYYIQRGPHKTSGIGDIYVGLKQRLINYKGFEVSAIPALNLPTGARSISSHQVDPEVKVVWAKDLSDKWSITGMEAFFWPADEDRKNFTFQQTVSLGYSLTDKVGMFLEYAGTFAKRGEPVHTIHSGVTYSPTKRQQYDVHYGINITNDTPGFFIAAGYSFRLDYLKFFKKGS